MFWIEATRGERVENRHEGFAVLCDISGAALPNTPLHCTPPDRECATFFRSAAKPFQALPLVRAGLDAGLSDAELALCCASHTGSAVHQGHVRRILAQAGLDESALRCGPHWPLDEAERNRLIRSEQEPSAIHNNCSGKHAGMLLYCARQGLDTETYLSPEHPLQREVAATMQTLCLPLIDVMPMAVDGCGAPIMYLPLSAMAQLFAQLAVSAEFARIRRVMTEYPELVGGAGRVDTEIMRVSAGRLLAKVGADGVLGVANLTQGAGLAVKIADGNSEVRNAVVAELLRQLGWLTEIEYLSVVQAGDCGLLRLNTLNQIVGRLNVHLSGDTLDTPFRPALGNPTAHE